MAFLSGGQIDISDTLTTLGEDRWAILEATLPPLGLTAKPLDLFDPVWDPGEFDYVALCSGCPFTSTPKPHPPGSVWQLNIETAWDQWTLLAFFAMKEPSDTPTITRFSVPFERLGLNPNQRYWATEFWNAQFLGELPGGRQNANGYQHPGDMQDLLLAGPPQILQIGFTGPAVKLLAIRPVRPHPWIVGTTFHQSCGTELQNVVWDPRSHSLSGRLCRPAGLHGLLIVAGSQDIPIRALLNHQPAPIKPGANGSWCLEFTTWNDETFWQIQFGT